MEVVFSQQAELDQAVERFEREHLSGSIPPPSTGDGCFIDKPNRLICLGQRGS